MGAESTGRPPLAYSELVKSIAHVVAWSVYSHVTRLVLLATGAQDNVIHGIQIQPSSLVRIPRGSALGQQPIGAPSPQFIPYATEQDPCSHARQVGALGAGPLVGPRRWATQAAWRISWRSMTTPVATSSCPASSHRMSNSRRQSGQMCNYVAYKYCYIYNHP